MEVKAGYKQTVVGVIPEEWDAKPLKGRISIAHGFAFASEHFTSHGLFRLTTPGHFYEEGGFRDIGEKQKFYIGLVPSDYVLRPGEMIVAMTEQADGLLGSAALIPEVEGYLHNQRLGRVRALSSEIDLGYLYYVFNSASYRSKVRETAAGTKVKHTSPEKLLEIYVPLPPAPEQRAIAGALSDVDGLLTGLDSLIAKERDLKQAAMQQLLTGQTRLPGFYGEWAVKRIKAIVQTPVTDGPHLTPRFLDDGIPFLSVNNLVDNKIDLRELRYVSIADHETFSRKCKPRKGDILLGKAASVGKVALVDFDVEFNIWSPIAMIRLNSDNDPRFVYYQFQSADVVRQITLLTNSSSQGNIGMGDIERLTIKLPLLPEQTAIAAVLSDMDAEIVALEQRREKTRSLKQAMMQELLTGKTRLVAAGGSHARTTSL